MKILDVSNPLPLNSHSCLILMNPTDQAKFYEFQRLVQQYHAIMTGCLPFPTYNQHQYIFSGPSRTSRNGRHHTVAPYHNQFVHGAFGMSSVNHPVGIHPQMGANHIPGLGSVQEPSWSHAAHSRQGNNKRIREKHGAYPGVYQVCMGMSTA